MIAWLLDQIVDLSRVERIMLHTSHHTHVVTGTAANDPQTPDPKVSREMLDHSTINILAVAPRESNRFTKIVRDLPSLTPDELPLLNVALQMGTLTHGSPAFSEALTPTRWRDKPGASLAHVLAGG